MILFVCRHFMRPDNYEQARKGFMEMNELASGAPGFVKLLTVIPETEPYTLTSATLWESREAAEAWLVSDTHVNGRDGKGAGGKEYADKYFFTRPPEQLWFNVAQVLDPAGRE